MVMSDYFVIPWRRKWQPTPVFFPGKSLGQRSLVGYSTRGHKELDTTGSEQQQQWTVSCQASSVHGISQVRILEWFDISFSRKSFHPGIEPMSPHWQADSLPLTHLGSSVNLYYVAATAKSLQSCPTLCDPIDGSPPGSTVSGILQARKLEWVAISFSNA